MPNRILKDTIRTSRNVNGLTDFQFRVWVYLITYVDDFGRGSADPELLKGLVFPRRKNVTEGQIQKAVHDLANIGMISLYEVDGEPYFYFPNWSSHQRIQTKKSKFPMPSEENIIHGDSRWNSVENSDSPPESNTIQNPNTNTNTNPNYSTEPQADSVLTLTLNDGSEYPITQKDVSEYSTTYPAVDVMQQLRSMRQWCRDNPTKRKTAKGIRRFINSWLEREQNKPHIGGVETKTSYTFKDLWKDDYG